MSTMPRLDTRGIDALHGARRQRQLVALQTAKRVSVRHGIEGQEACLQHNLRDAEQRLAAHPPAPQEPSPPSLAERVVPVVAAAALGALPMWWLAPDGPRPAPDTAMTATAVAAVTWMVSERCRAIFHRVGEASTQAPRRLGSVLAVVFGAAAAAGAGWLAARQYQFSPSSALVAALGPALAVLAAGLLMVLSWLQLAREQFDLAMHRKTRRRMEDDVLTCERQLRDFRDGHAAQLLDRGDEVASAIGGRAGGAGSRPFDAEPDNMDPDDAPADDLDDDDIN